MEQQYVLKTEVESNEEILLFYVDEDGGNEEGVLTTVDNIEQVHGQQVGTTYILGNTGVLTDSVDDNEDDIGTLEQILNTDTWTEEEIKRLLVFYIDNKETFITGAANKTHLWTVACKTMLMGKNSDSCEIKLQEMKTKYAQAYSEYSKGNHVDWTYFVLCHQAFYEEINSQENSLDKAQTSNVNKVVASNKPERSSLGDQKVEKMLEIYLKYIKSGAARGHTANNIWEIIATQLGADGDYWQKRFLNYKQHYLFMLDKRRKSGTHSVNWSYMKMFDEITEEEKKNKHVRKENTQTIANIKQEVLDWDDTEVTVLVKYYFDCLHEFQDPTIPNNFLWNEVSRLLDRTPEKCKAKFNELKTAHFEKYLLGNYDLRSRKPISILFDNIISREVQKEFKLKTVEHGTLSSEETDKLVNFFHDNIAMLKDPHCYFVCFACISKKLQRSVQICIKQWHELTVVYCNILNQKREDLDLEIYWKYIDVFDRIFDYGMDIDLLTGYEQLLEENQPDVEQIRAKKLEINMEEQATTDKGDSAKHSNGRGARGGDSKAFKILEYYLKNKDKFMTKTQKKSSLWEVLAAEIGVPAAECAHRFRNFKQVFTSYVQREINKPEIPIMWPYYSICKKVFGYRALKAKLRNGRPDTDEEEGWTAKEIKQLIDFFEQNYDVVSNSGDIYIWTPLACEIGKTERACSEKFVELRKVYRKLITVKSKRPDVKVSWKYFNRFHEICQTGDKRNGGESRNGGDGNNVDASDVVSEQMQVDDQNDNKMQDEIKYIFVIPEGQDPNDLSNAQLISKEELQKVVDMSGENETKNTELDQDSYELTIKTEYIVPELFQSDIPTVTDTPSTINNEQDNAIHANNDTLVSTVSNESCENSKKITKWTRKSKRKLLINYLNYIKRHKNQAIVRKDMWVEVSMRMADKKPGSCRRMFLKLKKEYLAAEEADASKKVTPYSALLEKILAAKPKFVKTLKKVVLEENMCQDVPLPDEKVQRALEYYYEHIEEFLSPKFDSKYLWTELARHIGEPITKVFNKVNYLKRNFDRTTGDVAGERTTHREMLTKIVLRETDLRSRDTESNGLTQVYRDEQSWTDGEIEQLLTWYLANLDKFKNPKFARSYLWVEVSDRLKRTPLECSKKMSEIRTQYRTMVNGKTEELPGWRFYDLCQKIYGTGKKGTLNS